jgi:poly(hydroxyalkanoate) depolymerase family esterase
MFRLPKSLVMVWIVVVGVVSLCFPFFAHTAHASSSGSWRMYTYSSSQGSRNYYVYTPANYQLGRSVPLVVMLHGCTQSAADFAAGTQMDALADQDQFVVVYPQQSSVANAALCWNWFYSVNQYRGSGEAGIIAGITQTVERSTSKWTIDAHRIYLTGLSAGAAMASVMSATYPDLYAAIGVHSGVEYQAATNAYAAGIVQLYGGPDPVGQGDTAYNTMGNYARVVPTIVFHGTYDTVVNPINGDQVVQQWMETDYDASGGSYNVNFNNPSSTTYGQVPGGYAYTVRSWNDSSGSEIEEYWTIDGMGHAWSGGSAAGSYTNPYGPSATQAMYAFFMNHTL